MLLLEDQPTVKRLIIAPHCDDEVLGCGGLLAKFPDDTAVVVLAEPDDVRLKEFNAARDVLGYVAAHFLGLEDGYIGRDEHRLVGLLDKVVAQFQPEELYVPFPSAHQDHMAAYVAGTRAGRISMTPGHHFTPSIYAYDVAAYDLTLFHTDLEFRIYESLSEAHIDAKVEALRCYASQAITGPHPINGIKESAGHLGQARKIDWAEQYAPVRQVRS